jgi:probable dihydroxyacetone kinase regulator
MAENKEEKTQDKRGTKDKLAASFKELLRRMPMEKITIKDITDLAGVIRPTFYNHFHDKYDMLEYIVWKDLMVPIKPLLINDMIIEGLTLLFSSIKNEKEFYKHAVKIEGQNSFEKIARDQVTELLRQVITEKHSSIHSKYKWLSTDVIATYYGQAMVYVAIEWIRTDFMIQPKELSEIYEYISTHSMMELIDELT